MLDGVTFVLHFFAKLRDAGKHLLKVAPAWHISNLLGLLGLLFGKRWQSEPISAIVGLTLDRDHNAAINILRAATALRGGGVVEPITPERPARERSEETRKSYGLGHKPRPL